MSATPLLRVRDLTVTYRSGAHGLRGVSFDVAEGERIGIVGESGCGKTTLVRALLGLLPAGTVIGGTLALGTTDLQRASAAAWLGIRGKLVGYVPQNPLAAFDPLHSVGSQLAEAWTVHRRPIASAAIAERLARAGITDAARLQRRRPHAWSGGMLQRAAIVAATALRPALVLADEPTSALDRPLARQTLALLAQWSHSLVMVTHDLDLLDGLVDRVLVFYAGRIVEELPAAALPGGTRHPYTRALLASLPRGSTLPAELSGDPPPSTAEEDGCAFRPRCARAGAVCGAVPALWAGVACHRPVDLRAEATP
jgi:peptide/nickel transport system ATP-binding protein